MRIYKFLWLPKKSSVYTITSSLLCDQDSLVGLCVQDYNLQVCVQRLR